MYITSALLSCPLCSCIHIYRLYTPTIPPPLFYFFLFLFGLFIFSYFAGSIENSSLLLFSCSNIQIVKTRHPHPRWQRGSQRQWRLWSDAVLDPLRPLAKHSNLKHRYSEPRKWSVVNDEPLPTVRDNDVLVSCLSYIPCECSLMLLFLWLLFFPFFFSFSLQCWRSSCEQ